MCYNEVLVENEIILGIFAEKRALYHDNVICGTPDCD